MRPDDLVGYQYRAADYCEQHVVPALARALEVASPAAVGNVERYGVENVLDELADAQALDRAREETFDSGFFPKVLLRSACEGASGEGEDARCDTCGCNLAEAPAIEWFDPGGVDRAANRSR